MPPIPELEDGRHRGGPDRGPHSHPNETTSLMGPTTRTPTIDDGSIPLTSSYGDLKDSLEVQLHDLSSKNMMATPAGDEKRRLLPTKKYVVCIFMFGIALLVGMSVLVASSMGIFQKPTTTHRANGNSTDDDSSSHNEKGHDDDHFDTGDGRPFSLLDPVSDLGLPEVTRFEGASPDWSYLGRAFPFNMKHGSKHDDEDNGIADNRRRAIPTNSWYQNLLLAHGQPSNLQRAYPSPYLVDVVGMIPGLRIHATHVNSNSMVMQLSFNEDYGLVVGAAADKSSHQSEKTKESTKKEEDHGGNTGKGLSQKYKVAETTDVGITLEWDAMNMTSNIVRGMAFVTMEYSKKDFIRGDNDESDTGDDGGEKLFPTIAAPLALKDPVFIDGSDHLLDCSSTSKTKKALVQKDIELYFHDSDFSWMVFFSQPVWIQCHVIPDLWSSTIGVPDKKGKTFIQVVGVDEESCEGDNASDTLVVRAALIDQCMTGVNQISCREGLGNRGQDEPKKGAYTELLRRHADSYPGRHTSFSFSTPKDGDEDHANLHFDWDPMHMSNHCIPTGNGLHELSDQSSQPMLSFALPHHMEKLSEDMLPDKKRFCKSTITGPACIVSGNSWTIRQDLPTIGLRAARPPRPEFIPSLAKFLEKDLKWRLPSWVVRGSGDTYFSGKYLSKLARILLIAEEVTELCSEYGGREFMEFCSNSTLPTPQQIEDSLAELRRGVQIWISGEAETNFVYDQTWGGVISCGCDNTAEDSHCRNTFPNCPGLTDPGLNFGNGMYSDHHFHYGYHIYSAAVLAHFDSKWGMEYFDRVNMLVRDIANPSAEDSFFPICRHKDWYQGSSWASGIIQFLNGRNQESSGEAIAAYEGVTIWGQEMRKIWKKAGDSHKASVANEIAKTGKILTGTELTSTKRYWHVNPLGDPNRIYPREYEAQAIGILWNTMAQFGTWFGAEPYLPIGIQLLPLTPISEERDEDWANSIYKPLTKFCAADFRCTESGWAILQLAILATIGYAEEAGMRVEELPNDSFENAGGNGQSRTNTLWYIATRPVVVGPIPILRYDKRGREEDQPKPQYQLKDCYIPDTCTDSVLDRFAGDFTCRERMTFLIDDKQMTEWEACWRVGGLEFPGICGECNPGVHFVSKEEEDEDKKKEEEEAKSAKIANSPLQCGPCTQEQCDSDLNSCPVYDRTFVCTKGTSKFGCSGSPHFWAEEEQCDSCCEMTHCLYLKDKEAKKVTHDGNAIERKSNCPPCPPSVCYGKINQCPIHTAPYLCMEGPSSGGCSSSHWSLDDGQCSECCEIKMEC